MVYLARDNRNSLDSRIAVSSFQASLIGGPKVARVGRTLRRSDVEIYPIPSLNSNQIVKVEKYVRNISIKNSKVKVRPCIDLHDIC